MVHITLDQVEFCLKETSDFSWLQRLGTVFSVFDQNDSGNISFSVCKGDEKRFIKVAGLQTAEAIRTPAEAIAALKAAMPVYERIRHPNLIQLIEHYPLEGLYIAVFRWAEGDCLFDHWNFDTYRRNPHITPPGTRFRQLPVPKRLAAAEVLFSFLEAVSDAGYAAVDSYDGSILYDFTGDSTTICDIDCFRRKPAWNDMGENYWGTKRIKAPEEYRYGAVIDEATNVFTLGALLFDSFFGHYSGAEIHHRYENNAFTPCAYTNWTLSRASYDVAEKAVSPKRSDRYASIHEFHAAWRAAL